MSNLRLSVLGWLLVAIPLGTTTALNAHVHQDRDHVTSHHDGAQSHRHAPDHHHEQDHEQDVDADDRDDALALSPAAAGLPGAPFSVPRPVVAASDSLPDAASLRPASPLLEGRYQPIDQSPPGDPPIRLSFKRGPPR